jgi:2'-5' RNA ligase
MRLFVALALPPDVRAHADAAVAPVRAAVPDLRWVPAERWHLTLAFYGEVPDGRVAGTERRVARRAAGHGAVRLRIEGCGAFAGRAVWLGVAGDLPGLRRLAGSLSDERRPYRPHLTVARLRGPVDPAPAVDALAAYAGPGWEAGAVHLVRSRLGPRPAYEDVAVLPLADRP